MKKNNVSITLQEITPEYAGKLLSKTNGRNRNISKNRVAKLRDDILSGNWCEVVPDAVAITKDGYPINGQHRLSAIKAANKPTKLFIAVNVPEEVIDFLDDGKPRTSADAIKISCGVAKNTAVVAATIKNIIKYQSGTILSRQKDVKNYQAVRFLKDNPTIVDAVNEVLDLAKSGQRNIFPVALASTFYWVVGEPIYGFLEKLYTGVELTADSIILQLRNLLNDRKLKGRLYDLYTIDKFKLLCETWDVYTNKRIVNKNHLEKFIGSDNELTHPHVATIIIP